MKTPTIASIVKFNYTIAFILCFIIFQKLSLAQTNRYIVTSGNQTSFLFNGDNSNYIGLATNQPLQTLFTPQATFHIGFNTNPLTTSFPTDPLFTANLLVPISPYEHREQSSVKLFYQNQFGTQYAVFQLGNSLFNYFDGNVGIGEKNPQHSLSVKGQFDLNGILNYPPSISHWSGISIDNVDDQDLFAIHYNNINSLGMTNPILIDPKLGVTTQGLLTAEKFRMIEGAGFNKVLTSNESGIATWTDASFFNDNDWLVETPHGDAVTQNLYSNPKYNYVGIGTASPKSKLHVVDGNIMISRSPERAPGSRNGCILFGEEITSNCPKGEWGIEYYTGEKGYVSGGLNFWKVFTEGNNNPGANYCLFIQNNGNVGINTAQPEDKFQVNEGFEKISLGTANGEVLFNGTSYLGFNASRGKNEWIVSSNGNNNGGGVILGDINGNIRFSTIPSSENGGKQQKPHDEEIADDTKMIISSGGNIGIGTLDPQSKLAVNGNITAKDIEVTLEGFPDYVFKPGYSLKSLKEVEEYIKIHNHLPEIPSEAEVNEKGLSLGEMNVMLLKKVEELTLYMISMKKEIEELKAERSAK